MKPSKTQGMEDGLDGDTQALEKEGQGGHSIVSLPVPEETQSNCERPTETFFQMIIR